MTDVDNPAIVNGLSVDVEDWFQVGAFENVIERDDWDGIKLRVANNVDRILDLFAEADLQATFFTLGWVGETRSGDDSPYCRSRARNRQPRL